MTFFKRKTKNLIKENIPEIKKEVMKPYEAIIFMACSLALFSFMFPEKKKKEDVTVIINNYYYGGNENEERGIVNA